MTQLIIANSAIGTHSCNVTRPAKTAISTRYLLGKLDSGSVAICEDSDSPIGIITDEAAAAGEIVNVALLGGPDTLLAVADSAIEEGAILIPASDGKVEPLPTSVDGTYTAIGVALTSSTAEGQTIEFISCVPHQHVVEIN
jgi:hypothetical protein